MMKSRLGNSFIRLKNMKQILTTSKIFRLQFIKFCLLPNCWDSDINTNYFLHFDNNLINLTYLNLTKLKESAIPLLNLFGSPLA